MQLNLQYRNNNQMQPAEIDKYDKIKEEKAKKLQYTQQMEKRQNKMPKIKNKMIT